MVFQMPEKNWFTVSEVAEILGVSPLTVYQWVRSRRLAAANLAPPSSGRPAYRISKHTLKKAITQRADGLPVMC